MLRILVISRRFYPPWCDGTVSYTKGLVDAILFLRNLGEDLHLTVLGLTDALWFRKWHAFDLVAFKSIPANVVTLDGSYGNPENITRAYLQKYSDPVNIAHVTYPGLDPISVRMALGMTRASGIWILKHQYMTLPNNIASVIANRVMDFVSMGSFLRLKSVFSSNYLENCYSRKRQRVGHAHRANIVPPAIDTERFRRIKIEGSECVKEIFTAGKIRPQTCDFLDQSDFRIIYFGPLIYERSRYDLILQAVRRLKEDGISSVSLMMIGRGFEDARCASQINEYALKIGLSDRIALASMPLAEIQKISLLNYADAVLQPYPYIPRQMAIVDPPITVLEAMAAERKVVVSGLGSLRDIVDHGSNGFLLPNFEVASLEETLLQASAAHGSVGVSARNTIVQGFSLPAVAKKLQRLYNTMGMRSK